MLVPFVLVRVAAVLSEMSLGVEKSFVGVGAAGDVVSDRSQNTSIGTKTALSELLVVTSFSTTDCLKEYLVLDTESDDEQHKKNLV